MMQESPRLPPMLSPSWTPPAIASSNSVDAGHRGTGKRARGAGILNGHHGRPISSVHHPRQQSQSSQDSPYPQSPVPSPAPPPTSPQQPSSIPPQSPTSLRDTPKIQATPKRASVPVLLPESPSAVNQTKGKDLWGSWLGSSLGSPRGRGDIHKSRNSSSPSHSSSELRTSGFDMTKLYPELSAKLGLTKPAHNENPNNHKNGITLKEHFNSGCLKKLEHVTDDSRIKIISTGQIINNTKGMSTISRIGNGIPSSKASCNSKVFGKPKHKSSDRGPRKDCHSRSSVRSDSSDRGSKRDGHSRIKPETSDNKLPRKDGHGRLGGHWEAGDKGSSRKDHTKSGIRSEPLVSGVLHYSVHGLSRSPNKGPVSSYNNSSSRVNGGGSYMGNVKSSIPSSSILEEQLRGGAPSPKQVTGVSSPVLTHHQHQKLQEVVASRASTLSATLPVSTASSCAATPSRSLVMAPATYPPSVAAHQPRVVTIPPRKLPHPALARASSASLPQSLLRVHTLREKHYAYNSDLFPLGVETSEESDTSDVDDMCGSQQGWVDPTEDVHGHTAPEVLHSYNSSNSQRSAMLAAALASQRRQVEASRLRSGVLAWEAEKKCLLTHSLVDAARTHPRLSSDACCLYRTLQTNIESPKLKHRYKSSVLVRRECVYNDGRGKGECSERSLPGTRHCLRHIMYNVDQLLFTHCTARLPDNTLCRIPVFDVFHELPLCAEHSKKKENINKSVSVEAPKPKRPRKKNKMPILSRYGKRSKKRRRSSNSTSSIIPSTSVRPPMASQSSLSSPQPSPSTPQTSPHFSTTSCTDSFAEAEESELEDDMEGMVEGLDAASRLLDPRDFQDVLNRIPDHELTQLFDAPEGKSGEFDSHTDDKEEIEGHRVEDMDQGCSSHPARTSVVHPAVISSTTTISASATPPLAEEGTTLSLDESTLNELVAGNIPIDSIISSSFNQQELNAISQALSNIVQENNINLAGFDLNAGNSYPASEVGGSVVDVSDSSLMSQTSDAAGQTEYCESPTTSQASECKVNLLSQRPGLLTDTATLSPLK
ncbi:hypothetical protein SK128_023804 [Halocaridina rubra]|uniref:KANL2-like probable zinc-finger domain-containing protein n=1 Tax=Halocaridina rubra TaxID=373956 RepID=A0AAN9A513_HALRR